jgi:hypothetical protein
MSYQVNNPDLETGAKRSEMTLKCTKRQIHWLGAILITDKLLKLLILKLKG